ncbi:MAG: 50S ribosomal protein L15 [Bacteroidota bacterium]
MNLSKLTPAEGSVKNAKKRIGRGQGSGKGGTSTKGHKGAQSRSGYSAKRGFEGGQMPLQRRLPKFGFKNINRIEYRGINLDVIQALVETNKLSTIDIPFLISKGLAHKNDKVKVLGRGELKSKVEIKVHAFSATAKSAIEAQGGSAVSIENA